MRSVDTDSLLKTNSINFGRSIAQGVLDMTGIPGECLPETFRTEALDATEGMITFSFFAGTIQGQYVLSNHEKVSRDLMIAAGVTLPPSPDALRRESSGFLGEIVNLAVAQTIGGLESHFGKLTFVPPTVVFGSVRFPAVLTGSVNLSIAGYDCTASVLLNLVNLKIARQLEHTRELLETRTQEATTDALTGIFNRAHLDRVLPNQIVSSRLLDKPLALLIIDVDHFKGFNDTCGHQTGDEVLQCVARGIQNSLRGTDVAARFGGDEFVVMLMGATADQGRMVAERIRDAVAKAAGQTDGSSSRPPITLSIGVAECGMRDDAESLLKDADRALYRAKNAGRNQVAVADGERDE